MGYVGADMVDLRIVFCSSFGGPALSNRTKCGLVVNDVVDGDRGVEEVRSLDTEIVFLGTETKGLDWDAKREAEKGAEAIGLDPKI